MEDTLHKLSIAKTVLHKKVLKEHFIYYRFYRQLDNQKVTIILQMHIEKELHMRM